MRPLSSVVEACEFIAGWLATESSFAGEALPNEFALPTGVRDLNAKLGRLWHCPDHPFITIPFEGGKPVSLFEIQDRLFDPLTYSADEAGVIPFAWENQGVWGYGFSPGRPEKLLVCGDWCDGLASEFNATWREPGASVGDAIICTLLGNLCAMGVGEVEEDFNELSPKPEDAAHLLWRHEAWSGFGGFWTNADRTMIHYSGMGLTLRRAL